MRPRVGNGGVLWSMKLYGLHNMQAVRLNYFVICPNLRADRIRCSDCWTTSLSPYSKPAVVVFCSLLGQPRGGTGSASCPPLAACWACGEAAGRSQRGLHLLRWGCGSLELYLLPCRVTNLAVVPNTGDGEGEGLTAGTLQPRVQWCSLVLCVTLPQSSVSSIAIKSCLFSFLFPFWLVSSLEQGGN